MSYYYSTASLSYLLVPIRSILCCSFFGCFCCSTFFLQCFMSGFTGAIESICVLHFLQRQVGLSLALKFHKGKRGIHQNRRNSAMVSSILSKSSLEFWVASWFGEVRWWTVSSVERTTPSWVLFAKSKSTTSATQLQRTGCKVLKTLTPERRKDRCWPYSFAPPAILDIQSKLPGL